MVQECVPVPCLVGSRHAQRRTATKTPFAPRSSTMCADEHPSPSCLCLTARTAWQTQDRERFGRKCAFHLRASSMSLIDRAVNLIIADCKELVSKLPKWSKPEVAETDIMWAATRPKILKEPKGASRGRRYPLTWRSTTHRHRSRHRTLQLPRLARFNASHGRYRWCVASLPFARGGC